MFLLITDTGREWECWPHTAEVLKGAPDRVLKFCTVNSDQMGMAQIEKKMQDSVANVARCRGREGGRERERESL